MTAQDFINKMESKLKGLNIGEDKDAILGLLNLGKNELAVDTLMWTNGEEIDLVEDTYFYTLSDTPIQILDVYDDNNQILLRTSLEGKGYYQVSPQMIRLNYNPTTGDKLYINYFHTPADYELTDTLDIHPSLYKALRSFILHEALSTHKSEKELMSSREYLNLYNIGVAKFLEKTDTTTTESLWTADLIQQKGLV